MVSADFLARLEKCERKLASFPETMRGARFLDIGSGRGQMLIAAAKQGAASCVGIEPFPFLSDGSAAQRRLAQDDFRETLADLDISPSRIKVHECGIESVSGLGGQFDRIMVFDVLEHVPDPTLTLRRAFEFAAPGCLCVASTAPLYFSPHGHHLWNQLETDAEWAHLRPGWDERIQKISPRKVSGYLGLNKVLEPALFYAAIASGWEVVSRKRNFSGIEKLEWLRRQAPLPSLTDEDLTLTQSRMLLRRP